MKNKVLQVGITGGIGSGKSLISKIFSLLGAPVYDADKKAKYIINQDIAVKNQITTLFGDEAYHGQKLARDYIAQIVFKDKSKLDELNNIVHPKLFIDYENWLNQQSFNYIIKEAALMIESGSYKKLDKIIVVKAPISLRITRTLKRDSFRNKNEVKRIISNQLSSKEKIKLADFVINNNNKILILDKLLYLHKYFMNFNDKRIKKF